MKTALLLMTLASLVVASQGCKVADGPYAHQGGLLQWCIRHCRMGDCPATHCDPSCAPSGPAPTTEPPGCTVVKGPWEAVTTITWCRQSCQHNPSFCPASRCDPACMYS